LAFGRYGELAEPPAPAAEVGTLVPEIVLEKRKAGEVLEIGGVIDGDEVAITGYCDEAHFPSAKAVFRYMF
jgi:hypothetical protein